MAASGKKAEGVGALVKRKEMMADGKRYIIYYSFGNDGAREPQKQGNLQKRKEEKKDV